jgi:hypothetical protein
LRWPEENFSASDYTASFCSRPFVNTSGLGIGRYRG